ncbi:hypothetical protein EU971_02860 [Yersinia pseudotuberculosis]|nr:hypothetical protein EU971_02860 [Yersinia pseudotuberculosis]
MSLRRKQPCDICNSDIIFPIFYNVVKMLGISRKTKNVNEQMYGLTVITRSNHSTQCGDNHSICIELCDDGTANP